MLQVYNVSLFISWIHLYTLRKAPHCVCVSLVDTRKEEEMKQEVTSQIRDQSFVEPKKV